jgi:hypothetical protein
LIPWYDWGVRGVLCVIAIMVGGCSFRVTPVDLDLGVADLSGADLTGADLSGEADMTMVDALLPPDLTVVASCKDSIKNGMETDTDCGGPACPRCAANQACTSPSDCASGLCFGSACSGGLVAYYNFDELAGTMAGDTSGNANHGTVQGGASWTTGRVGGGLLFAGSGQRVLVPHSASLNLTTQISISAWVTASSLPQWAGIIMKSSDGNWNDGYGLYHQNVAPTLCGYANNYFFTSACGAFTAGAAFHHVVLTYDAVNMIFYVDGVSVGVLPTSTAIGTTTAALVIGQSAGGFGWDGKVDEVRIFNRALSLGEVQQLFNTP